MNTSSSAGVGVRTKYQEPMVMGKMHKHIHYNVKSVKMMVFAKHCINTGFPQTRSIFLGYRRQLGVLKGLSIEVILSPGPSTEPGT